MALEKANRETYDHADIARIQYIGCLPIIRVRTADQQADARVRCVIHRLILDEKPSLLFRRIEWAINDVNVNEHGALLDASNTIGSIFDGSYLAGNTLITDPEDLGLVGLAEHWRKLLDRGPQPLRYTVP